MNVSRSTRSLAWTHNQPSCDRYNVSLHSLPRIYVYFVCVHPVHSVSHKGSFGGVHLISISGLPLRTHLRQMQSDRRGSNRSIPSDEGNITFDPTAPAPSFIHVFFTNHKHNTPLKEAQSENCGLGFLFSPYVYTTGGARSGWAGTLQP